MKVHIITIVGLVILLGGSLAIAGPTARSSFSAGAIDINFDQFPNGSNVPSGTAITSQYAPWGVLFSGPSDPEANGDHPGSYGPLVSTPNVLLAGGSQIWLSFVDPGSGLPAPTSAVGPER